MIVCVLAAFVPSFLINLALPPELFFVGLIVGALAAGFAISATCGMSFKRATIAATIYLAIQVAVSLTFQVLFR